jgi:hypothetical protein
MCPSLPPIYYGLASGIDGAALEKVLHGAAELVAVTEVIVQDPFFYIDPALSPYLYDFHGDHPLSL